MEHSSVIKITIISVAKELYIKSCKPNPGSEAVDILLLPGPLETNGKVEEMQEWEGHFLSPNLSALSSRNRTG